MGSGYPYTASRDVANEAIAAGACRSAVIVGGWPWWDARNATFCDLMVRTGLRLSEQAALSLFEVPLDRGLGGYQFFHQASPTVHAELREFLTKHAGWHPVSGLSCFLDKLGFAATATSPDRTRQQALPMTETATKS